MDEPMRLAERWKGRADDAGRLSRAVIALSSTRLTDAEVLAIAKRLNEAGLGLIDQGAALYFYHAIADLSATGSTQIHAAIVSAAIERGWSHSGASAVADGALKKLSIPSDETRAARHELHWHPRG